MKRTLPSTSLCLHQPVLVLIKCCVKSNIQSFCPSCCIALYVRHQLLFLNAETWFVVLVAGSGHAWVRWNIFEFFLFIVSICCLCFLMFASKMLSLFTVLRLFMFPRLLGSIGWNFTSYICLDYICSIFTSIMYELWLLQMCCSVFWLQSSWFDSAHLGFACHSLYLHMLSDATF